MSQGISCKICQWAIQAAVTYLKELGLHSPWSEVSCIASESGNAFSQWIYSDPRTWESIKECRGTDSRKTGNNSNSGTVKIPRSTWVSIAPLVAREIRHLHLLENLRLRLSTSLDNLEATVSVKINHCYPETGTKCGLVILSWCHLVYNLGSHSLMLTHVDVTVPHSSEECSPQSFSVSFPNVDSNSVKHRELMPLLWDSVLLLM